MFVAASRFVVGLIGAVLLYVALFLRETEEGKLQNRLEKLWVEIDDLSKAALSKQTAFLQRVAAMADSTLNKLFGARLLSAEAVSTSLCFSVGAVMLVGAYVQVTSKHDLSSAAIVGLLVAGSISLLVGVSPIPFRYLGLLWIPGSVLFVVYVDWGHLMSNHWRDWAIEFLPLLLVLGGGFFSDVLFIAGSRWCLRRGSQSQSGGMIIALLTLNGCLGLVLVSPMFWSIELALKYPQSQGEGLGMLFFLGASNVVTGAISLLFILLALSALVHLAVWPILERPVYSLQRYGLVRQPSYSPLHQSPACCSPGRVVPSFR